MCTQRGTIRQNTSRVARVDVRQFGGALLCLLATVLCLVAASATAQTRPRLTLLGEFEATPGEFYLEKGVLYFAGAKGGAANVEPWTSNGTVAGTVQRGDLWEGPSGSFPHSFGYAPYDYWNDDETDVTGGFGQVFFVARNVWRAGVGGENIDQLHAMPRGGGASYLYHTPDNTEYGGRASFSGVRTLNVGRVLGLGREEFVAVRPPYWWFPPGMYGVNIRPGPEGSFPRDIVERYGDAHAFTADDGAHGREYVTFSRQLDVLGNPKPGALVVHDLRPGAVGSSPQSLTPEHWQSEGRNAIFFTADDGTHGRELWRDFGGNDIQMVKDINPGASGSSVGDMVPDLYGSLVFAAYSADAGRELWKSDGTEIGTVRVKDIRPGAEASSPGGMRIGRHGSFDVVYFAADNGASGRELWRSDGTEGGTVLVRDIRPGAAGSNPLDFVVSGGLCYFTADAEGDGIRELWVTDGSASGTRVVADWLERDANPRQLIGDDLRVYFSEGNRLYAYDPAGRPPPAAPSGLWGRAMATDKIEVGWNDNSDDECAFEIYVGMDGQPPVTKERVVEANVTSARLTRLYPVNTRLTFSVRAASGEFNAPSKWSHSLWPPERHATACTHAGLPTLGKNLLSVYPLERNSYHPDGTYAFTNPLGFDNGQTVSGFAYAWNMNPNYVHTGSEPVWSDTKYLYVAPYLGSGSYYLHLRSVNQCGEVRPDTVSVGPYHFDFQPPSAPGTPVIWQDSGLGMHFAWDPATDSGSGIASYECRVGIPGGNVFEIPVHQPACFFTGVEGESYFVQARAIDNAGNVGPWSPASPTFTLSGFGSLQVTINPPAARLAGAQWRRKGATEWRNSGYTEGNVWAGNRVVEFKPINGWLTSANQAVTVLPETLATATGTYAQYGLLTVLIDPPQAVTAGARWRVWRDPLLPQDSWKLSGFADSLPLGSYQIEFKPTPGWNIPDPVGVTITGTTPVERTGTYTVAATGSLRVDALPAEAVAAGARWRRTGTDDWLESGDTEAFVPVGGHTVEFKPLAGWDSPDQQPVSVALDETATAEGTYVLRSGALRFTIGPAGAIADGAQWRRAERLPDPGSAPCATVAGSEVPLTCDGSSAVSAVDVALPGMVTGITLQVDIASPGIDDIEITLYAATAGRETFPVMGTTLSGGRLHDTVFDDHGAVPIRDGSPPYAGVYRPDFPMAYLSGIPASGRWELIVTDLRVDGPGYETTLNSWSLCVTTDQMVAPGEAPDPGGVGPWMDSGVAEVEVPTGAYRVEFSPLAGWETPDDQVAVVELGAMIEASADYVKQGTLTVHLLPSAAVAAGAAWRPVGVEAWFASGDTICDLAYGFHTVEFSDAAGWTPPAPLTVFVAAGVDTHADASYSQQTGRIQVEFTPAAVLTGARWRHGGGGNWQASGESVELPLGTHTLEFIALPGWTAPAPRDVTLLTVDQIVVISAAYTGGCGSHVAYDTPMPLAADNTILSEIAILEDGVVAAVHVLLDINCNSTSALDVRLYNPEGVEVVLFSGLPNDGTDFEQTGFDDTADTGIASGFAPYSDIYAPQEPLAKFQGQPAGGVWQLAVTDLGTAATGSLNGWLLCVAVADPVSPFHTADQDGNGLISLSELLRVIQFYNSDGYHCAVGTEDGFDPGPGPQACAAHASDYNPQDWRMVLTELLRLIQFYNSGGYHACPGDATEDGYCPGL